MWGLEEKEDEVDMYEEKNDDDEEEEKKMKEEEEEEKEEERRRSRVRLRKNPVVLLAVAMATSHL